MATSTVYSLFLLFTYSISACSAQAHNYGYSLQSHSSTVSAFEEATVEERIQQGLRNMQLQMLKQRAEMVLLHLEGSLPHLQEIQAQIEEMLESNFEHVHQDNHAIETEKILSRLNEIEDKVIPEQKLIQLHTTLYSKSVEILRVSSSSQSSLGKSQRVAPSLETVSQLIQGKSWVVEIRNMAGVDLSLATLEMKGVTWPNKEVPYLTNTGVAANKTKIYAFSVTANHPPSPRAVYRLNFESSRLSIAFAIEGSNQNCFRVNFFQVDEPTDSVSNRLRGDCLHSHWNAPLLKNTTISTSEKGYRYVATVQVQEDNYKLKASITITRS